MELDSSADGLRTRIIHHQHDDHEKYEDQHKQHHFHVLAVDDSLIDRKLLERLLTVSSYQVTCVDSGDKALEYLGLLGIEEKEYESSSKQSPQQEVSKINMIMTDYSMPGITGYDLLKRIKDSSWKNIPVVVMSSENVPSRINMCLEGGAEEFLLKPVKPSDLEKLHTHLLKLNDHDDDDDQQLHYSNISKDNINSNDIVKLSHEEDNAIAITINKEISVVCNSEDNESDMLSTCSIGITNSNKRKTISSTTSLPSTANISSDVSDRRARVQELSVNS